jgi:hypothetical protein
VERLRACKGAGWGGGRSYLWSSKPEATACAIECSGCAQRAKRGRRRSLPEHPASCASEAAAGRWSCGCWCRAEHPAGCVRSELRGRHTECRRCRGAEQTDTGGRAEGAGASTEGRSGCGRSKPKADGGLAEGSRSWCGRGTESAERCRGGRRGTEWSGSGRACKRQGLVEGRTGDRRTGVQG